MRKTCLREIHKLARKNKEVVFIGSDISIGPTREFAEELPQQFFMEGISEGHLIGMMTGLAMNGKIPYLNTLASFITRRCFEQIMLDAGLHRQPLRLIGSGGGVVYAPLGPTHLAVDDFAILRIIPNMTIVAPCDADEMSRLMPQSLDYPGPMYIRLAKGGDKIVSRNDLSFNIGEAITLKEGLEVLLVSTGVTTQIALEAAELLEKRNISSTVLHMHTIKPFDTVTLKNCLGNAKVVVAVEEHNIVGGLGSAVAECIAETRFSEPKPFLRLGLPDQYLEDYGSQQSIMEKCGLTASNVADKACELLK